MKKLDALDNHLQFNAAFSACRDPETGKIDWLKVASMKDLPAELIDKYYSQLKHYCQGIENVQDFPGWLIEKKQDQVNWATLIRLGKVDETTAEHCIETLKAKLMLFFVLRRVKLSFSFFEKNWMHVLQVNGWKQHIQSNINLADADLAKIITFLEQKNETLQAAQTSSPHGQRPS